MAGGAVHDQTWLQAGCECLRTHLQAAIEEWSKSIAKELAEIEAASR